MSRDSNAPYDHVDAPYILLGLVDLYRKAVRVDTIGDRNEATPLIEYHSGECHLMAHLWDTSIEASRAISSIIDFDEADLGMFAYEHLDDNGPGSLIYAVWVNCVLEHKCAADIVSLYVTSKGWPTRA